MRRLALLAGLLALTGTALTLIVGASAQGSSTANFDVIFDDAKGLISGQLVKVAGAKAGTISDVVVTKSFKARVEGTIDSKFMPFRQDASCSIRPEGLIAENYVACDPGTPGSPILRGVGGQPPTVPVSHTTEPVSLLDLFNIFNVPTRERFTVLVNELGIGTAGEGTDFNAILRRANPALALARQTISILTRQQAQLAGSIDATNTIAAQGAGHAAAVQSFLERSATLARLTAAHQHTLSQTLARLPGLLSATRPALAQVDTVAREGTPLLAQIHTAVPALNKVATDLGPFVTAVAPGLNRVAGAIRTAIPAVRATTPLVATIRTYLKRSLPGTVLFSKLLKNVQPRGFVENFFSIAYYIGAALARYDGTSHLLSLLLVGPANGTCAAYATTPSAACSAHYGTAPAYKPVTNSTAMATVPPASGSAGSNGTAAAAHRSDRTLNRLLGYLVK